MEVFYLAALINKALGAPRPQVTPEALLAVLVGGLFITQMILMPFDNLLTLHLLFENTQNRVNILTFSHVNRNHVYHNLPLNLGVTAKFVEAYRNVCHKSSTN